MIERTSSATNTPTAVAPGDIQPSLPQLAQLNAGWATAQQAIRERLASNPLQSLTALVGGGAALYYLAERGRNEKVRTYWDALEFVSTCASVGYSNIFPNTPVGKLVATGLFLFGPTLTSRVLDPPAAAGPPPTERP